MSMDDLRHPECRYCDEYERVIRGKVAEIAELKKQGAARRGEEPDLAFGFPTAHGYLTTEQAEEAIRLIGTHPDVLKGRIDPEVLRVLRGARKGGS